MTGILVSIFIASVAVVLVWLFFFVHAIQRIENQTERACWALMFLLFNIICVPFYYTMRYRSLKLQGKGSLVRNASMFSRRIR